MVTPHTQTLETTMVTPDGNTADINSETTTVHGNTVAALQVLNNEWYYDVEIYGISILWRLFPIFLFNYFQC